MPWGACHIVLWILLDGGPSRSGPLLGSFESMQGGTLGTNPHHIWWFDDKILIYAVTEHRRGEEGKGNARAWVAWRGNRETIFLIREKYLTHWLVWQNRHRNEGFVASRSIGRFSTKQECTNTHTKHTNTISEVKVKLLQRMFIVYNTD
jgi:hypothetical protein